MVKCWTLDFHLLHLSVLMAFKKDPSTTFEKCNLNLIIVISLLRDWFLWPWRKLWVCFLSQIPTDLLKSNFISGYQLVKNEIHLLFRKMKTRLGEKIPEQLSKYNRLWISTSCTGFRLKHSTWSKAARRSLQSKEGQA